MEIGDRVKFTAANVFVWSREESQPAVPADAEIEGTVVRFSDSGSEPRVFAVVEIVKKQTVVVRVSELQKK